MAELVGDAYVRLTVNSSGMRGAVKRAGEEAGETFGQSFSQRVKRQSDQSLNRMLDSMAKGFADLDFSEFERKMGDVDGAVRLVSEEMDTLRARGQLTSRELRDMGADLRKWEQARKATLSAEEELAEEERLWKVRRASAKAYIGYLADIDRESAAQSRRLARQEEVAHKTRLKQIQQSGDAQNRYWAQLTDAIRRNDAVMLRSLGHHENRILRIGNAFDRAGDRVQNFGNGVGRIFGRGSRNNALNLFGRTVSAMFVPLRGVIELVGRVGQGVGMMVQNFTMARTMGASAFGALRAAAGPALMSLTGGLLAAGAAVLALSFALPALVSGFFLLGGAITAVVGALSMGLMGGLLALGPLLLAVGGGVGALVIAFKAMGEKGNAAAASLDRIKKAWSGAMKGLGDETHAVAHAFEGALIPLIKQFVGPLMEGMLMQIGKITTHFGQVMQSPEIQGFLAMFVERLPGVFRDFGMGINNLLGGILGLFAAVLPQGESLASGFQRLTARFLEFTKSSEGQNKIQAWMDTAWEAANSLWSILGNVASILGKIFRSGTEGAGQSFLTYIDDITTRFDTFLSSAEGQTAMQTFWTDVRDLMVTVKDIFEKVGTALKTMDTEQARADFQTFADTISAVAGALDTAATALGKVRDIAPSLFPPILFSEIARATTGVSGVGQSAWDAEQKMLGLSGSSFDTSGKLSGLSGSAWDTTGKLGGLTGKAATAKGSLDTLNGAAGRTTGGLDGTAGANSRLQGALGRSSGALGATSGAMAGTKTKADLLRDAVKGIPSAKGVTVTFNTVGYAAMKAAGDYFQSLQSRRITLTVGTVMIGGEKFNAGQFAEGGRVYGPTHALIGEAGPEAVVPLNRPLSQVDPSVRALSAIAQGKSFASGGVAGGKQVTVESGAIVVQTSTANPMLVAQGVLDRIAVGAM